MRTLFDLSGLLVLPIWAMAILLPNWRVTRRLMASPAVAVAPALLYAFLVMPRVATDFAVLFEPTLEGISALLGSPEGATIAWVHFLCFDLFVGRWIYLDARKRGLPSVVVSPILFLTLMFGPLGFATFLAVRSIAWATVFGTLRRGIASAWRTSRSLTLYGLVMVALAAATAAGLIFDERVVTGAPVWMKPAKFAVSNLVYAFTLVWMLGHVRGRERLVLWASRITAWMLAVEMVVIVLQAARGTTSHFNVATPLDTALWAVMALAIMPIWIMGMVVAFVLVRERSLEPSFAWSLRLGMIIAVVGMGLGFLMTGPSATQLEAIAAHGDVRAVGGHTIGGEDGGPGLPVVGWSTTGGDLRVAHFIGLHAMQALPLAWLLLARFARRLPSRARTALVTIAGAAYLALTLLTAWQALRGQPLTSPDALTLGVATALAAATLGGAAMVVLRAERGRRSHRSPGTPAVISAGS